MKGDYQMKMVLHKSWGTFTLPEEFCSLYGLTTFDEKEAIERFKQSDNFKGDAATKRSIFQRFKNYFN